MTSMYVQTSGDFDTLDPVDRLEARQELFTFLERERGRFRELHLHLRLKRLGSRLGTSPLLQCTVNLSTDRGKFNVVEEAFGTEAAVKSSLLALRYQLEKHHDILLESREKAEGRKAVGMA